MATKSILKNITIKDRRVGRDFVTALETAHKKKSKDVIITKKCSDVKREDIKSMFGE